MKVYAISGLGADRRAFQYLKLDFELIHLDWILPLEREAIEDYAFRLAEKIDATEPFGIIGLSFGGMMAVEVSKLLHPVFTVLISTVEVRSELRPFYRFVGKTKLFHLIPKYSKKPPNWLAYHLFGTRYKQLLIEILEDTDPVFLHWAIEVLVCWGNNERLSNQCVKVSGDKDLLMPVTDVENSIIIKGGTHMMIMDMAEEVSLVLNDALSSL